MWHCWNKAALALEAVFTVVALLATAEQTKISNVEQFINWAKGIQDGNFGDVVLECDLDLTEQAEALALLPIGLQDQGAALAHTGTFDGNNHTIIGMQVQLDLGTGGFFAFLKDAVVKNVVFDEHCVFRGGVVGAVAAVVGGNVVLENVVTSATVVANTIGGGLVGSVKNFAISRSTASTLELVGCSNKGSVTVEGIMQPQKRSSSVLNCGGLLGANCPECTVKMTGCSNFGTIASTQIYQDIYLGGLVGDGGQLSVLENCTNEGKVAIDTNNRHQVFLGGLVGVCHDTMATGCSNKGEIDVHAVDASYGGLIGTCTSTADRTSLATISDSENIGQILGTVTDSVAFHSAGGLVGMISANFNISRCENVGPITFNASVGNVEVGGLPFDIAMIAGGLAGKAVILPSQTVELATAKDFFNHADVLSGSMERQDAALILAAILGTVSSTFPLELDNCGNSGNITGTVAYGVASHVTKASQVVNTGYVNGSSCAYSDWSRKSLAFEDVDNLAEYLLSNLCEEPSDAAACDAYKAVYVWDGACSGETCKKGAADCVTFISKNSTDGSYTTKDEQQSRVDALLNKGVADSSHSNEYSKAWSTTLELVNKVVVTVDEPVSSAAVIGEGQTMDDAMLQLTDALGEDKQYHFIVSGTIDQVPPAELEATQGLDHDESVLACYKVTATGEKEGEWFVVAQKPLSSNSRLVAELFNGQSLVVALDNGTAVSTSFVAEQDTTLTVYVAQSGSNTDTKSSSSSNSSSSSTSASIGASSGHQSSTTSGSRHSSLSQGKESSGDVTSSWSTASSTSTSSNDSSVELNSSAFTEDIENASKGTGSSSKSDRTPSVLLLVAIILTVLVGVELLMGAVLISLVIFTLRRNQPAEDEDPDNIVITRQYSDCPPPQVHENSVELETRNEPRTTSYPTYL